ncbi:hypothetical protein R5W23_001366 [Gemmata sp. JC673]|uniref:AsmA-like C-terminal domain-containing protein n=1 Tax=Gemmata algarum TaxID=2975278 RepID=A0ABU5F2I0_9BACT|nr:hypothetical protein [Gemmata algarum]MDY3560141.1 hypothetical protein [Gemmata algarum]
MRVRSWLIRGLILAGVAALVALGWVANSWISPDRVREKVIATLADQLDNVDVQVGSARLRILGGIAVSDLRLSRRGDPPDQPFLAVPSAVLFHDKEQLNRGRLVIKKVRLENPTIRIERAADGSWNIAEVIRSGPADKPVPTFEVKGATVVVTDHAPDGLPATTFTGVEGTLLNDPLPALTVQGSGTARPFGPVSVRGRFNRINSHLALSLELAEFPVGPASVSAARRFAPELAPHLAKLTAVANVKAEVTYAPEAAPHWRHDVRFDVKGAKFEHPDLPKALENITATVRSTDGRVKVDEATATLGDAKLKVTLETRPEAPPAAPGDDPLKRFEDRLLRLDLAVTGVPLDDTLFDRLPDKMKKARRMFAPTGLVDVGYKLTREAGGWRRELEARPRNGGLTYEKFRYPVADVRGLVRHTVTHAGGASTTIDLLGDAAGQLITIKGRLDGEGEDPAISLRVTGTNVPLDETLCKALPPKSAALVREFRASGRGDFVVEVTQQAGVNLTDNEFRIDVKDGKLNYTAFPYPLEKVKGRLVLRTNSTDPDRPVRPGPGGARGPLPDRDEIIFDGFTAVHAGAAVWMNGSKRPIPDSRDRKLVVHVGGTSVPLNAALKTALGAVKAENLWAEFQPRGALTFTADVEVIDRAPPPDRPDLDPPLNPATDVKVTFGFSGPTVTPRFFAYELTEFSGWLEYKQDRLDVAHLSARHGPSRVKLAAGEVRFYSDGAVWANLGGIEVKPCVADAEFKKALPGKLGAALDELQLRGGAELLVKHLVISAPPGARAEPNLVVAAGASGAAPGALGGLTPSVRPEPDPVVYWDAELKLFGAALDTGIAWEDAHGSVACRGRYEGTHLGPVRGTVWLDRAVVSRVPVTVARCQLRADPQQPDPARPGRFLPPLLQLTHVAGDLFHGELGGQAWVVLAEGTRYEVWLTAANVQLEELARHYNLTKPGSDSDLKGVAQAQLLVFNRPDPKTGRLTIEGTGKIDVPTGRMYNLPVLLELVKVLKLNAPDKTAFEQAHVVFRLLGDRIKVEQLDLLGKAICLGGSGELDTSGEYVKFEFYTVLSQVLKMSDTLVGDLTAFLSRNLYTIKLTRENGELKYRQQPVPAITDPARAVLERLKRGTARFTGK